MWCRGALVLLAGAAFALSAAPAQAEPAARLAGRCVALQSARMAEPALFGLKATGPGTFLLHDADGLLLAATGNRTRRDAQPGPAAEWALRGSTRELTISSTANGRELAAGPRDTLVTRDPGAGDRFRAVRARGCSRFPEAELDARGRPRRSRLRGGTLFGLADAHLHITADLRAGGRVIYGESFDRFGIAEALGHDADVHGPDGALDVTGNLLRSGSPLGTHDTHGWPTFAGWPTFDTNTHQQVYYRWLERAWRGGLRLVVAQTVEDEPLCRIEPLRSHSCDETEAIELEVQRLRALQDYVDAQAGGPGRGFLRIVTTPRAARRAIERGRLAVIIGVESSNPFGCSEFRGEPACDRADIDHGIRRLRALGIRSLFVAHWVDNALAGAALEGGDKGTFIGAFNVIQTGSPFQTGPCPDPAQGSECNTRGLTDLGAYAVRRLMDEHMLIEVDHLSERAREQVLAMAEERRYPLVSSHTGTGGTWTPSELQRLRALGGFATATLDAAAALPVKVLDVRRDAGGPIGVGLGTDTGGFASLPGPAQGSPSLAYPFRSFDGRVVFERQRSGQRTFDLNVDGMAHYGLLPDLLADVQRQPRGREALGVLFRSAEAYLRTWERTGLR